MSRRSVDTDMTDPRAIIDDLLEILVVPSFTKAGYLFRRRLFGWEDLGRRSLAGRTILVTGPTSGLGRAAAAALARMGARLVLVGRNRKRLEETRAALAGETGNEDLATVVADMSLLSSVRAAAAEILEREPRLDAIIDNAGAMFMTREVTDEGFERTLATMVLGPWVLIASLLPRLVDSPDGRIVAVTSGGMYTQRLPLDDLQFAEAEYDGPRAYARAKRAQVALVREWARRLRARGVTANAMHPGWADTPGVIDALPGFSRLLGDQLRTADQGSDTMVWLAAAEEGGRASGRLYLDRRPRPFDRLPVTRLSAAERRELWEQVAALTGEPDPVKAIAN
jgi:dehydrogenase/reductase SDR family member 12